MLSVRFLTKHGVRSVVLVSSFLLLQVRQARHYAATLAKFSPPVEMDFSTREAWPQWKTRFSRFLVATKTNTESDAVQIATLLYSLGPSADGVFERELTFADGADRDDFDNVLSAFDAYFSPAVNVIHERTQLATSTTRTLVEPPLADVVCQRWLRSVNMSWVLIPLRKPYWLLESIEFLSRKLVTARLTRVSITLDKIGRILNSYCMKEETDMTDYR